MIGRSISKNSFLERDQAENRRSFRIVCWEARRMRTKVAVSMWTLPQRADWWPTRLADHVKGRPDRSDRPM